MSIWKINATTAEDMRAEIVGWLERQAAGQRISIGMERTQRGKEAARIRLVTYTNEADFWRNVIIEAKDESA